MEVRFIIDEYRLEINSYPKIVLICVYHNTNYIKSILLDRFYYESELCCLDNHKLLFKILEYKFPIEKVWFMVKPEFYVENVDVLNIKENMYENNPILINRFLLEKQNHLLVNFLNV